MTEPVETSFHALVVDEQAEVSLLELSRICGAGREEIHLWVAEGLLEPDGSRPDDWRFGGQTLLRARRAARLRHDLEIDVPGVALALDLLEEIDELRARLLRLGAL